MQLADFWMALTSCPTRWHLFLLHPQSLSLTGWLIRFSLRPENTHLLYKGKYHCMADLIGFKQINRYFVNLHNQSG